MYAVCDDRTTPYGTIKCGGIRKLFHPMQCGVRGNRIINEGRKFIDTDTGNTVDPLRN